MPAPEKVTARRIVTEPIPDLVRQGIRPLVRVNDLTTGLTPDDVVSCAVAGLAAIRIPKVESAATVREADRLLGLAEVAAELPAGSIELIPTVATAAGCHFASAFATASPRVAVLSGSALRGGDTQRSISYRWTPEGLERFYLRSKLALASSSCY